MHLQHREDTIILPNSVNSAKFDRFIYLFISTYNDIHMYDSGYYVEVKDDDDKNYYLKETDKDKEGWLKWVGR